MRGMGRGGGEDERRIEGGWNACMRRGWRICRGEHWPREGGERSGEWSGKIEKGTDKVTVPRFLFLPGSSPGSKARAGGLLSVLPCTYRRETWPGHVEIDAEVQVDVAVHLQFPD
jgi:hypothetical protein